MINTTNGEHSQQESNMINNINKNKLLTRGGSLSCFQVNDSKNQTQSPHHNHQRTSQIHPLIQQQQHLMSLSSSSSASSSSLHLLLQSQQQNPNENEIKRRNAIQTDKRTTAASRASFPAGNRHQEQRRNLNQIHHQKQQLQHHHYQQQEQDEPEVVLVYEEDDQEVEGASSTTPVYESIDPGSLLERRLVPACNV